MNEGLERKTGRKMLLLVDNVTASELFNTALQVFAGGFSSLPLPTSKPLLHSRPT